MVWEAGEVGGRLERTGSDSGDAAVEVVQDGEGAEPSVRFGDLHEEEGAGGFGHEPESKAERH